MRILVMRIVMGWGLAAVCSVAASCGAQADIDNPAGSQTHFLRSCPGGVCGDGLVCTCGVCTLPCSQASDCAAASDSATCESAEASCSQARSICSRECNADADCASLGDGFRCQQGECRGEPLLAKLGSPGALALVGEACIAPDEWFPEWGGATFGEISWSFRHAGCGGVEPDVAGGYGAAASDGVCITYHFVGRASCPEGQVSPGDGRCRTTLGEPVTVPVPAQDPARPAGVANFCSCRCDGAGEGVACRCPAGMTCEAIIAAEASYCVFPLPEDDGPGTLPEQRPGGAPLAPPSR